MCWSEDTLTTIEYGDLYITTGLGKTLTAFISILGIGCLLIRQEFLRQAFLVNAE